MEIAELRCPACDALVVDRRFAKCTSCGAELPASWILSAEQMRKLAVIDHAARSEHAALMEELAPERDENTPLIEPDSGPSSTNTP